MQGKPTVKKVIRFRTVVLLGVLVLVGALYAMLRQDRIETELRNAVMQSDVNGVHAALRAGANAKAEVLTTPEPNVFERILHGQNPFVYIRPYVPPAPSGRRQGSKMMGSAHTLLMYAAESGSVEILDDLIAHGADMDCRLTHGGNILFLCIGHTGQPCLEALLRHGAKPNVVNDDGMSPLHIAAATDSTPAIRILLDHGADVGLKDHGGRTPLIAASRAHAANACLLLLQRGADPRDLRGPGAMTPEPDSQRSRSMINAYMPVTPLAWACAKGSLPLAKHIWEQILSAEERRAQGRRRCTRQ